MDDPRSRIRAFVVDNFLFGDTAAVLPDDASFTEGGIIDSTGVLELVAFVEETFAVQIADEEMTLANLDSIAKVAAFVGRKQGAPSA